VAQKLYRSNFRNLRASAAGRITQRKTPLMETEGYKANTERSFMLLERKAGLKTS
jgi:hypothetical protein